MSGTPPQSLVSERVSWSPASRALRTLSAATCGYSAACVSAATLSAPDGSGWSWAPFAVLSACAVSVLAAVKVRAVRRHVDIPLPGVSTVVMCFTAVAVARFVASAFDAFTAAVLFLAVIAAALDALGRHVAVQSCAAPRQRSSQVQVVGCWAHGGRLLVDVVASSRGVPPLSTVEVDLAALDDSDRIVALFRLDDWLDDAVELRSTLRGRLCVLSDGTTDVSGRLVLPNRAAAAA